MNEAPKTRAIDAWVDARRGLLKAIEEQEELHEQSMREPHREDELATKAAAVLCKAFNDIVAATFARAAEIADERLFGAGDRLREMAERFRS